MRTFNGQWTATAIGSLPHTDEAEACRLTLDCLEEAPAWPQLPRRSFLENMYVQYSEGLPGRVVDVEERRIWCEDLEGHWEEVEAFLRESEEGGGERFAISPAYAAGLHAFVSRVSEGDRDYPFLKGQVTGPFSFGLTVTDAAGRPIIYNDTYADLVVRLLGAKARWMRDLLTSTGRAGRVLVFFDEPYLSMVGSALVSVQPEFVVEALDRCVEAAGCLTGVHCCGNTDWSLLMRTRVDVVNFDAYEYLENLALYPREIAGFLERGGTLAWGLVPNDRRVEGETVSGLRERLEEGLALLEKRGVPSALLERGMFITPSCGMEGTDERTAASVYRMLEELAGELNRG